MSDTTLSHNADPWWGNANSDHDSAPRDRSNSERQLSNSKKTKRSRGRKRSGVGWFVLALLLAPLIGIHRLVARSQRLRRLCMWLAVVITVLFVLASSVGVILINNVVVGRTVELGELEDARRELRRDNALLGAQKARLEAPDVVYRRARAIGMVATTEVPDFIYLYGDSRTMNARQRRQVAVNAQHEAAKKHSGSDRSTTSAGANND